MADYASPENHTRNDKVVFWGCFIALVTTSFAFFSRLYLCNTRFPTDFGLEKGAVGSLAGAGIWPFAISIILFSLIIDRIGYKVAMLFSFACYATYLILGFMAYQTIQGVTGDQLPAARAKGYDYLYWGSVILALGNGTVEAFINPVVATMFNREKTKWLNILHAGWPGGLTFGGIITIALADVAAKGDWRIVIGIIAVPAVIYLAMLSFARFPVNEREQAGVSYRSMLAELGGFGALIAFGLIGMELANQFPDYKWVVYGLAAAAWLGFVAYTQSFGRPIMAFLIIIMMPLAVTEIGTDGWITGLMKEPMEKAEFNPGWVLVYTSVIMMVLRFFAGPIVHKLSPIGLLILSSALAVAGLFALSKCGNAGLAAIFAAATLYALGKTFFWPTMLGITSEQCPKGGALTLNAISGIGMIAVGVLGFPFIGAIQENKATTELKEKNSAVAAQVVEDKSLFGQSYQAVNPDKAEKVTEADAKSAIAEAKKTSEFEALATMALFPTFMLVCYLILFLYFKSRGGYRAQDITHGGH
jgi:MFS family permease